MPNHPTDSEILSLVRISACVAIRNEQKLREQLELALDSGLGLPLIREALLQTYLFAGYAAAINALMLLNEVIRSRGDLLSQPDVFWQEENANLQDWKQRGEDLCKIIYGSHYEKLIHNMKQLHPDLADWILWEGYGKVLSRPFLNPVVRELLIVSMTAALGVVRQFHSHVRGALHVGATTEQLYSVMEQIRPLITETEFLRYEFALNEVLQDS